MKQQREYAKRLTRKETLELLEKAFKAGEELGQENAKSIYWTSYIKLDPSAGFEEWVADKFKNL
jgi:hypothetical protein